MTIPRKDQIILEETPFYHCVVRCVRQSYLCGYDAATNKNYDHRKQWIVQRLKQLASIFCIDVCGYSVMSNHYHVVLHVDLDLANSLTEKDICLRIRDLHKSDRSMLDRYLENKDLSPQEIQTLQKKIPEWHARLKDISWFMKYMNQPISRSANKEENMKGSFFDNRFYSQALLDDRSLLTCLAYVDLNPVRAGVSVTLEDSDFTSIQRRLYEIAQHNNNQSAERLKKRIFDQEKSLENSNLPQFQVPTAPLVSFESDVLPVSFEEYLGLVEETGKVIRQDKRGFLKSDVPQALTRLGIDDHAWLDSIKTYKRKFGLFFGSTSKLRSVAENKNKSWCRGVCSGQDLYQDRQAA